MEALQVIATIYLTTWGLYFFLGSLRHLGLNLDTIWIDDFVDFIFSLKFSGFFVPISWAIAWVVALR